MVKGKATLKVAPGLAKVPQGQGIFLILLVGMTSIGLAGTAYYADTCCSWSPNHPLQLFGICAPPATLAGVGGLYAGIGSHIACVNTVAVNRTISGTPTIVYIQQPAGTYEYLNGNSYP